jgi:glycosyltransferase involved in cell wall biosynthesis
MSRQTKLQKDVVIVAMLDSPHTAGWLKQFITCDIRFILIPSTPHRKLNKGVKDLLQNNGAATFHLTRFNRYLSLPVGLIDLISQNRLRAYFLNRQLTKLKEKIDFIHVHEIQHAGYIVLKTIEKWEAKPQLVVSVWGSDLYWFGQFKNHRKRITRLMKLSDQLICECARDVPIAESLGYVGNPVVVMPVSGGLKIDTENINFSTPSLRKTILVKGYTGFVGRAELALESIERISSELTGFEIVVFSSDSKSRRIARRIEKNTGLHIRTHRRKAFSQSEMLNLFRTSRIYIGMSESDGLSVSMLEAMASGCFPIQTSTSCATEILKDGLGGFVVDLNDKEKLDLSILQATSDDFLVDNAAAVNLAATKLNREISQVTESAISVYQDLFDRSKNV